MISQERRIRLLGKNFDIFRELLSVINTMIDHSVEVNRFHSPDGKLYRGGQLRTVPSTFDETGSFEQRTCTLLRQEFPARGDGIRV